VSVSPSALFRQPTLFRLFLSLAWIIHAEKSWPSRARRQKNTCWYFYAYPPPREPGSKPGRSREID